MRDRGTRQRCECCEGGVAGAWLMSQYLMRSARMPSNSSRRRAVRQIALDGSAQRPCGTRRRSTSFAFTPAARTSARDSASMLVPQRAHVRARLARAASTHDLAIARRQRIVSAPRHQQRFRRVRMVGLRPVARDFELPAGVEACASCSPRRRSGASAAPSRPRRTAAASDWRRARAMAAMKMSDGGTRIFRPCRSAGSCTGRRTL